MSVLKRIQNKDRDAAKVLKEAGLCTDWDIQTLTREDLHELFPGRTNFKRRRNIYELIHKQKPIDDIIKEVKGFIPHDFFRAALTDSGVLIDYLRLLKDLRSQMTEVQGFFDSHINLLEGFRKDQSGSLSDTKTSDSMQTDDQPQDKQGSLSDPKTSDSVQTDDQPQDEQVKYKTVVSGKTLGADKQVMEKVMKSKRQDWVQFVESSDDHMVNILFCPISSRIGSDIDAALSDVKDDKPVILVLMHHERQPKYVNAGIWTNKGNIVMYVNVYYHDTVHGLIMCKENDNAISEIQKTLLKYSPQTCEESTRNAQGAGAESGRVGSTSFNDDRHSGNDSSSSVFSLSLPKMPFRTSKKQN